MRHEDSEAALHELFKAIDELVSQKPPDPDEEINRQMQEAFARGNRLILELDPIVREKFRDQPDKLAEWDEIMHTRDDIEDAPPPEPD